jgi:putative inorganic carbon (HCO3(-)) transporter
LIAAGLVVAMGIAWAGRRWGDRALGPAGVGCALLAAAVGAYFLLANDWSGDGTGKFVVVQDAGMWIQAHRPAVPLPEDINGNVAGSALAVLIPLGLGGAVWAWETYRNARASLSSALTSVSALASAVISTFALILSLFALLLTASRGAWLGLAAGGLVALVLAWSDRRRMGASSTSKRVLPWVLIAAITLASAAVFFGAVTLPGFDRLLGSVGGIGNSALGRAALWRDGLALAGDYPFTGAGLGSTMMVYSTYALLLHVGFITHSHNLFLQIALEQGLPGLAAFLGLLGLALWTALRGMGTERSRGPARIWQMAAAASLVVLVVHGTMDTGIYARRVLSMMFLPFGFAFAGQKSRSRFGTKLKGPQPSMP